ncbi:hypothetical protein [Dyadobacter sp. CY343]|uniref:hypothetical protein n=1 Tax=Dyadobacter sp. CY343 TaxID=2907299 RepID=UPI001F1C52A4|nr:hypothetical protein [Dyadobacter sp. CY343]MCE7058531.1 hypothetical protein [Dyadobacter sp. CY343]
MKKFFAFVLSVNLFFSCVNEKNKDKPPAPEPAAQIAGSYRVTLLKFNGKNVPLNDTDVLFQLDRLSDKVVTGKMKVVLGGKSVPDEDLCNLYLTRAGYAGIDLFDQTEKIGHIDKTNRLHILVIFEGRKVEIVAVKK